MTALETAWYKSPSWSLLLLPLSWLFSIVTRIRRYAYRMGWLTQHEISVPVIIVGNISVGGTGKTPFVVWLVEHLQSLGYSPGVIARGYGANHSKQHSYSLLLCAASKAEDVGDEPLLVFQRCQCPVAVGRNRMESAQILQKQGCDIIISDDGLQHYALARDIEIAIVDGSRGFGNQQLLPAGPLREPPSRLTTVDLVVVNAGIVSVENTTSYSNTLFKAMPASTFVSSYRVETLPLHSVQTHKPASVMTLSDVQLVCGIGNPERFYQAVLRHGINADALTVFPDHHGFTAKDFQPFEHQTIIMTEKDAVKCRDFAESNWYYLPISAEVQPEITVKLAALLEGLR